MVKSLEGFPCGPVGLVHTQNFRFLKKRKTHFGDRKHKPIYRHKADIAVPRCPLLEGKQESFAGLELFSD
jgi:hypothetical protein